MSAIPEIVSKLLPRLASEHDGEVIATARAIERSLRNANLDYHDLVKHIRTPCVLIDDDWRDVLWDCIALSHRMRPNERVFIRSLAEWNGDLTEKQRKWLDDIAAKLRGRP